LLQPLLKSVSAQLLPWPLLLIVGAPSWEHSYSLFLQVPYRQQSPTLMTYQVHCSLALPLSLLSCCPLFWMQLFRQTIVATVFPMCQRWDILSSRRCDTWLCCSKLLLGLYNSSCSFWISWSWRRWLWMIGIHTLCGTDTKAASVGQNDSGHVCEWDGGHLGHLQSRKWSREQLGEEVIVCLTSWSHL
jgi:hypothetical protein